jgi:acetyl-CoA acetyltransferase
MKEAVIVAAARTAVGRASRGTLVNHRPDEMAATVVGEVLRRAEGVEPGMVEDVIPGCTGAKLTVQIVHEMQREAHRYGMVAMCIGGGMGAVGVVENLTI